MRKFAEIVYFLSVKVYFISHILKVWSFVTVTCLLLFKNMPIMVRVPLHMTFALYTFIQALISGQRSCCTGVKWNESGRWEWAEWENASHESKELTASHRWAGGEWRHEQETKWQSDLPVYYMYIWSAHKHIIIWTCTSDSLCPSSGPESPHAGCSRAALHCLTLHL